MDSLVADFGDILFRSPQIAVEVTRLAANLPEGIGGDGNEGHRGAGINAGGRG